MKVQGQHPRRAAPQPSLKALEQKALNKLDQAKAKADQAITNLESLVPDAKPQLEKLREKVDGQFTVERAALSSKLDDALSTLQALENGGGASSGSVGAAPASVNTPAANVPKRAGHAPARAHHHPAHHPVGRAGGGLNLSKIPEPYRHWAPDIEAAAQKNHLPAAYIAAVMSRETNGINERGDGGHGRGLMQIDDRSWGPWLAAHNGGMDPKSNIEKGAEILRANLDTAHRLGLKGNQALKFAASAYNGGVGGAESGLRLGNSDRFTTGHNYGADVLQRMKGFEKGFGKGTAPIASAPPKKAHHGHKTHGRKPAHGTHRTNGTHGTSGVGGISANGRREMAALLRIARNGAGGRRPMGWCLKRVEDYLDAVSYGKIGHGHIPRFGYAHQFADYLNAGRRYEQLGLKKLNITNPYDAPPGAIIVVRHGTPGTHHPTAGDIVVKGNGSHFYNDGEMGYGGPGNFPPGNDHVLGIYVPA